MSKSNTRQSFSRRNFIGASAAAGLAGVSVAHIASADPPADKFKGKKPLKPAPALAQAAIPSHPLAVMVLNKAAYGPRPGDIDAFNALGANDIQRLDAWLLEQLNPSVSDPDVDSRLLALESSEIL